MTTQATRPMVLAVLILSASFAHAVPYQIPDAELLDSGVEQYSGYSSATSTLDGKAALPGQGVEYLVTLSGPDDGKMGIGDPWPTSIEAGLGWDSLLRHWTSLDSYDSYQMSISYTSGPVGDIDVSLLMNTGLTGPSGFPSNDVTNNTFWAGPWTTISLGEAVLIELDFDYAWAWDISDNKEPHTGGGLMWPDGEWYPINSRDLNEVSNIGFQIADFDADVLGGGQITLELNAVPEPATLLLLATGCCALAWRRRGRAF